MKKDLTPRPPTIADVARVAGVSRTTVSHSLNDLGQVAAQTREHVKQIAAELGYRPNIRAQRLRSGRSSAIALLSSMHPAVSAGASRLGFFTDLAVGCAESALLRGYFLALAPPSRGVDALKVLDIDGAILLEPTPRDPVAKELRQRNIPFVAIGGAAADDDSMMVDLRHGEVARLLLEHLCTRGCRQLGLILGTSKRASQVAFRQHYLELARLHGFVTAIVDVDEAGGEEAGYAAALQLLKAQAHLDGLCVPIDALATGAVAAAASLGRQIGNDLLIATRYDGLRARSSTVPLTAVDLHLPEVSARAVALLLAHLEGEDATPPGANIPPPQLIVRASTAGASRP